MPCPPSHEEREMANLDWSAADLEKSLRAMQPESAATVAALEMLKEISRQHGVPEKLLIQFVPFMEEVAKAADFRLDTLLLRPKLSDGFPEEKDLERMRDFNAGLREVHNALELALCKSRTLIYLSRLELEKLGIPLEVAQEKALETEKERHLAHRNAERKAELQRLRSLLAYYQRQIKLQEKGILKGSTSEFDYQKETVLVTEKVERIKSLSDHELLSDRLALFGE